MEGEIQFVGYTDQHDKLQAMLTLKKRKYVENTSMYIYIYVYIRICIYTYMYRSRSDYGLDFGVLHRKHIITDRFRAGIQKVPGRQHNGQHLVWNHMHYKSFVVVAGKPHVRSTRGAKWE